METPSFKLIVAGSRGFRDYAFMCLTLDQLLVNKASVEIVSGTAGGADRLGEMYAKERGYPIKPFPADWNTLGKRAGYVRNKAMAIYADACCVFWDGNSPGSRSMINICKERELPLRIVTYNV